MIARRLLWWLGTPVRVTLLWVIAGYRASVGRLVPGRCRFHPTCSAYAYQAIGRHGVVRGVGLAAWRVLRCSPLTAGGIDPVPERRPGAVV